MRLASPRKILNGASVRWILTLLVSLGLARHCLARDVYVDNEGGDDRRNGATAQSRGDLVGPLRTIKRALALASPGDRIVLAKTSEPYRESITLQAGRHSGTPTRPFIILGNGAILDGRMPVPIAAWEHFRGDVFRFAPNRKAHQILYLGDKPAARQLVDAGSSLPELAPLEWCLFRGHVYFRTEPGQSPQVYDLSHTALPVGLGLYEVRHVVIEDLVVQGFQLDGVNAHDSVFGAKLVALTCRGNGRAGIAVGGSSRVEIESCLSGANAVAQVLAEGYCHVRIVNSELLEAPSAPKILRRGGDVQIVEEEAVDEMASLPKVQR